MSHNKRVISWALYDWANSAFATVVMAGFFPVFFKQYWSAEVDATVSTFHLGMANSLASVIIVALAPVLGAIADQGSARKRFLMFFAAMGMVMTGALYLVAEGQWLAAVLLYILALIGFSGGNIFYDALIISVADNDKMDSVSALGFALGYLGGGILFAINVAMTYWPQFFGLADAAAAVRVSFVCVAIWWAVFSVPVFLFVPEPQTQRGSKALASISGGFRQLARTFSEVRKLRVVFWFLLGYWFYIDAVDTIIRMAVDYGLSIGFQYQHLVLALLVTQFVGFPAALVFGKIGERFGAKTGIFIGIAVYIGITLWAYFIHELWEFYILAIGIGLVQGGVQSLSRSLYARIIPRNKVAEFFGFYNMLGKFAAVMGPVLMGWVSVATGNPRYSIISVLVLLVLGAVILYFVDEAQGRRMAQELEHV